MLLREEKRLSRSTLLFPLLLFALLSLLVNADWTGWGLPSHYSWAPDAIHPYTVLNGMERRFSNGWFDKYPPLQYLLNATAFVPVLASMDPDEREALEAAKDAFYRRPDLSRDLVRHGPERAAVSRLIRTGRMLNAFMGALSVIALFLAARELFGGRAAGFAAWLAAFHPITVFYGHTMNTEAPCFAWSALGLYAWFRALRRKDVRSFVMLGVFAALAGATKEQAYALFVFIPFVLAAVLAKKGAGGSRFLAYLRAFFDRRMLAGALCFVAAAVLANNLLFNLQGFREHLAFNAPGVSVLERVHPLTWRGCLDLAGESGGWIVGTLSPALTVLCTAGAVWLFLRDRGRTAAVLLPAVSYFLVFLGYIGFVQPRYVTPMVFCLILLGGRLLADLSRARRVPAALRWAACAAALLYAAYLGGGTSILFVQDPRLDAEAWLTANVPEGARVLAVATPKNTLCRLPRESTPLPVEGLDSLAPHRSLLERSKPDFVVIHLFAGNITWKDPAAWQAAVTARLERDGYAVEGIFSPSFSHPALYHLFLNPWVMVARGTR